VKAMTVVVLVECCVAEGVGRMYVDREMMVVVREARTGKRRWWRTRRRWGKKEPPE